MGVTVTTDVNSMMQDMFRDMTRQAIVIVRHEAVEVGQLAVQSWPVGPGIPQHSRDQFTVRVDEEDVHILNAADYVFDIPVKGTGRGLLALDQWLRNPANARAAQLANLLRGLLTLEALNG